MNWDDPKPDTRVRTWSFYDAATGKLATLKFHGRPQEVALNTPPGHVALDGDADPQAQRFDLASGKLVAATSAPHPKRVRADAHARIAGIESHQARAVREALIAILPAGPERDRLLAIDAKISALRPQLR